MDFNNDKFEEQFSERNVFVDELIHENIKLFQQNLGLFLDNNQLKERLEELEDENRLSKNDFIKGIYIKIKFAAEKDDPKTDK